MATATAAIETIEQRTARIVDLYHAQGDLELMFCRQIASSEVTYESLERLMCKLSAAEDADDRRIDRVSRAQARAQRMGVIALKELKALQNLRNVRDRFQDQTKDCPPLADHTPYVGHPPKVHPIPPRLRGHMQSPTDHTPRQPAAQPTDPFQDLDRMLNLDLNL